MTRDSVLTLARDLGLTAETGRIDVDRWRTDATSGALTEVFASGTSAMITPVGVARGASGTWTMGDGTPGPVTMRLRGSRIVLDDEIRLDVQRGSGGRHEAHDDRNPGPVARSGPVGRHSGELGARSVLAPYAKRARRRPGAHGRTPWMVLGVLGWVWGSDARSRG